jgi:serine phosphatase RsbU (regulator of sigma subunit)
MSVREDESDIVLASRLQAALLPDTCPGDCGNHVMEAANRMSGGVGGDFYDLIRLNQDQIVIMIGDVIGHGIRAALVMAQIMGFTRSGKHRLSRPLSMIRSINDLLIDLGEKAGTMLTCSLVYGVIDTPTGTAIFVNAGHPYPILFDAEGGNPHSFGPTDLMLGVEDFEPTEICHTFLPGERMVMFTDGIVEAHNHESEQFGDERFRQVLTECRSGNPRECVDAVFGAVDEFRGGIEQEDDETVIVIDRI